MTTFQPLVNYSSYNHILQAGAHWTHPVSGYTYACACEQKGGARQNLSVYRMRPGGAAWEHVQTYYGTVDAEGHITMGAASIEPNGDMLVTTSLTIKGAEKVTGTGFQGCWLRKAGVDAPYLLQDEVLARPTQDSDLLARLATLERTLDALPLNTTGPVLNVSARSVEAGGRIQFEDGAGGWWIFDVSRGALRRFHRGAGGEITAMERVEVG